MYYFHCTTLTFLVASRPASGWQGMAAIMTTTARATKCSKTGYAEAGAGMTWKW